LQVLESAAKRGEPTRRRENGFSHGGSTCWGFSGALALLAIAAPVAAQEVTVLCNFEVDWCEALKTTYEKTTGQKAVFIRRTDGESLAQIRAEKNNPRADVYHAAESASAKQLAAEGLLEAYKVAAGRRAARLGAAHRRGKQVFSDADLHRASSAGATTRSSSRRRRCRNQVLEGSRQPGVQDEIQMANPGTSVPRSNTVSTVLQLMGRGRRLQVSRRDEQKRFNQYTRSGSAGIRAAAKGETTIGITFPA